MTTDDKQTPDPTTPALLSAARPVLAWTKQDEIQGRPDEWEAYAGPYRLRVERRGENDYQDADGDSTPHPDLVTAQLAAEALCRARLPLSMAGDQRALDALTPPAAPDGEALGQMLLARLTAELSPTWAKVLSDVEDEHWNRAALALDAHGYARGVAAGEAERARMAGEHEKEMESARASTKRDTAMLLDLRAEIARLTAERDAMAVELTEARDTAARAKAACDKTEGAMLLADREEDKRVAAARRDGAREEREAIRDKVDHDARFGADSARGPMLAIVDWLDSRARGEGQGS